MTHTELRPGQLVLIQPGFEQTDPWVRGMDSTVGTVGRVFDRQSREDYVKVEVRVGRECDTWFYLADSLLPVSAGPVTKAEWLAQVGA